MKFNLGYQSGLLLFFFLQGIIFTVLILKKGVETENRSAYWLSAFIFLCCLYICPWMFGHAGWYATDGYREVLFFVPFQHYFLMAPVILFYVKSLTDPGFRFNPADRLHFIPGALYIMYSLVVFVADVFFFDQYWFYADGRDKDLDPVYQIAGTLWMIGYTFQSIRIYRSYRSRIFDLFSFADAITFKWLRQFLVALIIILTARVGFLLLFPNWGDFGQKFWFYAIFSCLFYYVALKGFIIILEVTIPYRWPDTEKSPQNFSMPLTEEQPKPIETASGSAIREMDKDRVTKILEESELFKNPTLSLVMVAKETGMSYKQLSEIINQGFGMNFNDFINSYRVEEVKHRIRKGDHHQFTLLSIAMDSGFNSKSTFNRAFKKRTGLTPAQFITNHASGDSAKS